MCLLNLELGLEFGAGLGFGLRLGQRIWGTVLENALQVDTMSSQLLRLSKYMHVIRLNVHYQLTSGVTYVSMIVCLYILYNPVKDC